MVTFVLHIYQTALLNNPPCYHLPLARISFGIVLKSEFRVIVQAVNHHLLPLLRILPLLRLLRRLLLLSPHRIQAQLQLLQHLRQQSYHLHHLLLLPAVLLLIVLVDLIILAPMACAAVSGAIVERLKHTVENAAKATAVGSLIYHLVQAHPVQVLLQTILHHLLGSTMMLTTEKIAVSLHMLGTGKLVPPMSKSMLIRTS